MKAPVDIEAIIDSAYARNPDAAAILVAHSRQVRNKALQIAQRVAHLRPDTDFIAQAAMLHDIGMIQTRAPSIACHGTEPYIRHGVIGRSMLEAYGLQRHGMVCERHIGAGLLAVDIEKQSLPLPARDMVPQSLEETIICYADAFFSKTNGGLEHELEDVLAELMCFGQDQADRFMGWHRKFNGNGEDR
jgi:uncharacterized protein